MAVPTAITQAVKRLIGKGKVRINGKISNDGGEACDVRFRWGETLVLQESHNTGESTGYANIHGTWWPAQTFTASANYIITSVKLLVYRHLDASPGTVTVSIRATDVDGHPTGSDLCSGTTNGDTLTEDTGGEWREITLGAGYNLVSGTKYAIVVRAPDSDIGNYVGWRYTAAAYDGGQAESSTNSGSSYTGQSTIDLMFEVYSGGVWTTVAWDETGYNTDATFYHDLTGLDSGTEYEFQVQAKNTDGEGAWSVSANFTATVVGPFPAFSRQ